MLLQNYISKDYPTFNWADSTQDALLLVKDFGYSHVFVEKNGIYVGGISVDFLEETPGSTLNDFEIHFEKFALLEEGNLLDSIKLFHIFNANVVPVISSSESYLGYISSEDIFNELSKYPLFSENGIFITLQTQSKQYSFSEISNIIEQNNAKIYGIYISAILENYFWISIKISQGNLDSIQETFERYGYLIIHKHYSDQKEDLLKDRFGFLQKYLEY